MSLSRRQLLKLAAAAAAIPAGPCLAQADTYPNRPMRVLVGFAAGGNFDTVARLIGQRLSEQLGQAVVIENRPGAGSNIATEALVRSPADGYTLLLCGAVNATNAALYDKLSFNFMSDVAPIAGLVRFPNVMAVKSTFPAKTVPEFIAYAKANPGKVNQGSSGRGTTQHLSGELFKMMTGVEFVHVPYRGASQAVTDLLSGQVQVLFEPLPVLMEHIKAGNLRLHQCRAVVLDEVDVLLGDAFAFAQQVRMPHRLSVSVGSSRSLHVCPQLGKLCLTCSSMMHAR